MKSVIATDLRALPLVTWHPRELAGTGALGAGPDPLPNAHPTYWWSTPVRQDPTTQQGGAAHQREPEHTGAHWGAVLDPPSQRAPDFGTVRLRAEPHCPLSNSSTPELQCSSIPVLQDPTTQHPTSADQRGIAHNGAHWGAVPDPLSQRAPDFGTVRLRAEPHCPLSTSTPGPADATPDQRAPEHTRGEWRALGRRPGPATPTRTRLRNRSVAA